MRRALLSPASARTSMRSAHLMLVKHSPPGTTKRAGPRRMPVRAHAELAELAAAIIAEYEAGKKARAIPRWVLRAPDRLWRAWIERNV